MGGVGLKKLHRKDFRLWRDCDAEEFGSGSGERWRARGLLWRCCLNARPVHTISVPKFGTVQLPKGGFSETGPGAVSWFP
jgi:hypothetical protein